MLSGLFDRQPLLDQDYAGWIFDVYAWAMRNFDPIMFRDETLLVTPTNQHFPGKAKSHEEMANMIFERVLAYAGMTHWPLKLLPPGSCPLEPGTEVQVPPGARGSRALAASKSPASLTLSYDANYLNNPEVTIALFAHGLAHYLATSAVEPPPGGTENWPFVTEILAVFLGFGLMFANTALIFPRGGCCGGPVVQRRASLSENDITYALAIFTALKGIPQKDVMKYLKKSLRGYFRQALREVKGRYTLRLQEIEQYYK